LNGRKWRGWLTTRSTCGPASRSFFWAKQAWKVLAKAGLTAYRNKVEHHSVLFRLLALSGIYSDFCDVAFDETSEIEHSYSFELDNLVGGNSGRVFRAGGSRGGGRVR